jgi:PAS domain S-box-containing protein
MPLSIQFQVLAESSLNGIYLIQDDLFRYVNPALARMFGYTVEEVVDRLSPWNLVYPVDQPVVRENIRRPLEGDAEEIRYEVRGLRKDGSVFPIEIYGRRIDMAGRRALWGCSSISPSAAGRMMSSARASSVFAITPRLHRIGFGKPAPITRSPIFLESRQIGGFPADSLARDVGSSPQIAKTSRRSGALISPRSKRTSPFATSGTGLDARMDRRSMSP